MLEVEPNSHRGRIDTRSSQSFWGQKYVISS